MSCGCVALVTACGSPGSNAPATRAVVNRAANYMYEAPSDWLSVGDELRSREGSLFSVRVLSLRDSDPDFVAGLPQSVFPQLEKETRYFYQVVEGPAVRTATLGDGAATEVEYTVHTRASDPPARVVFWVKRWGDRLYLLRAAFAPTSPASEEQEIRRLVSTWAFVLNSG